MNHMQTMNKDSRIASSGMELKENKKSKITRRTVNIYIICVYNFIVCII